VTKKILLILGGLILFFIYLSTSAGRTPYDYYLRLADALLHGRYWLTSPPSWLSELVPSGSRFYTVFPPMPAILALPFVLLFGQGFQQQWLAHILGVGVALFTALSAYRLSKNSLIALWVFLFASLGTINWYLSATGSVWYLGQITAEFFISAAIFESLTKKRVWLVGILIGAAYWSRLQTILSLPFFIILLRDQLFPWLKNSKSISKLFSRASISGVFLGSNKLYQLLAGVGAFIILNGLYNFIRYQSFFDIGYLKIPGLLQEPWYSKGLFNLAYVPEHLKVLFSAMPKLSLEFPFIQPSWGGLAIWITTPGFIYLLRSNLREIAVKASFLAILLIGLVDFSHGGTGWTQFGYRYAVDFYPFLMFLTIKGVGKKLAWHHWLLLFLGIIVNLWGVLWINKFGWVGW